MIVFLGNSGYLIITYTFTINVTVIVMARDINHYSQPVAGFCSNCIIMGIARDNVTLL